MEKKQTAVQWFLTEFQKQVWFEPKSELDIWIKNLMPKAKEMEKQQIINSYDHHRCIGNFENGKQYYNETFNK